MNLDTRARARISYVFCLCFLFVAVSGSSTSTAFAQEGSDTQPETETGDASEQADSETPSDEAPAPEPTDDAAEEEPAPAPAAPPPAASGQFGETVAAAPAADRDPLVLNFQLGSTLNMGNTRSWALAASSHFEYFADTPDATDHLFTADLQFSYGLASLRDETTGVWSDWNANAQNVLGKLRYDLFFTLDDAVFAAVWGRNDPFAGLDFRFQGQLGYARNLFREGTENKHRLWIEAGFDFTYDDRVVPVGATFANEEARLSGRAFVGYDNHINENWQLLTGLEALLPFVPPDASTTPSYDLRLSSISELRFKIDTNLQFGLRFTLLFDNQPVPGRDPIDTTTVLNVVYTAL